ncbi:MAG: ubiquinol-cytochrome C chaperone family protein [Alphaproteobacteria bacterium]|nr:ubiquinol-cytochrome C chaperone family protein [Alphaproteobacteria bacterium]
MSIFNLFQNRYKKPAYSLYQRLVEQARSPLFYETLKIEDSIKGRFELILIHAFLVLHRLKKHKKLGQNLFDLLFYDLDRSIRELGVGDLSVGKKIKSFAELFYARIECYEKGLDDFDFLKQSLVSFFEKSALDSLKLADLALYMTRQVEILTKISDTDLIKGEIVFEDPLKDLSKAA